MRSKCSRVAFCCLLISISCVAQAAAHQAEPRERRITAHTLLQDAKHIGKVIYTNHIDVRLRNLNTRWAVFTYHVANTIFYSKQHMSSMQQACWAAHASATQVLGQHLQGIVGGSPEDAQLLAAYWPAAAIFGLTAAAMVAVVRRRKLAAQRHVMG